MGVNNWDWAILILDIGREFGVLGALAMSTCLSAAAMVVVALSLSGSISTATAVGPALLLLLGKLGVCLLVLYSAKLVGLWGLSTAAS